MEKRNGSESDAQKFEGFFGFTKRDAWNGAELRLSVKDISKRAADDLESFFVRINGKSDLLPKIVWPNVIETHNVISVAVGKEDCVEAIDAGAQALLAKIRGGVDNDVLAVAREEQGRAQAVVMWDLWSCKRGNGIRARGRPWTCRNRGR